MDPIIYIIIGFFVLLGVMWLITQPLFWFGAATVVLIVVSLLIRNRRASQLRARVQFMDSEVLATLDGYAFETYFSKQLGNLGIRNLLTKKAGDFGVDIFVFASQNYAVQLKHYSTSSVGVGAIQEVYSGAHYYGYSPVVLTTSCFSKKAVRMAEKLGVELIDGMDIEHWHIRSYSRKHNHIPNGLYRDVQERLIVKMEDVYMAEA